MPIYKQILEYAQYNGKIVNDIIDTMSSISHKIIQG